MRFSSWKLRQDKFRFEAQNTFLTWKVFKHWNSLSKNMVVLHYVDSVLGLTVPLKHIT